MCPALLKYECMNKHIPIPVKKKGALCELLWSMLEISMKISGCSVYIPNDRWFINAVSSIVVGAGLLEHRQLAWSLHSSSPMVELPFHPLETLA